MMTEYQPTILLLPSKAAEESATLALEVLPHGLTIHKFLVQANGQVHDIVIGSEDPQDHALQKYMNTVIGRYTNRIPAGEHTIERLGVSTSFRALPNENAEVSLHGGPQGFDSVEWTVLTSASNAQLFTQSEKAEISNLPANSYAVFRFESQEGDQGFSGKLMVEAFICLLPLSGGEVALNPQCIEIGSCVVIYRAKLDERGKSIVTPINLTQHWGFNLEASTKLECQSVKDHRLTIRADNVAELNKNKLPTGKFRRTMENKPHFHAGKKIGDFFPDEGYDDYYLFEDLHQFPPTTYPLDAFTQDFNLVNSALNPQQSKSPVVELRSDLSGIALRFQTNQHGVMFYSYNYSDPSAVRKKIHGGSATRQAGDPYDTGSAAFLEFHNPLGAFLFPTNKDRQDTLLTSNEIYHNFVRCDISYSS
ncbi:Galactose mutarotase-like domain containing protein [Amanita muscaria]